MIGLTFEELENYRQNNGYINMDMLITNEVESEREVRGNDKRDKNWFDIKDGRIMFKINSEEQPFSHYSQLICCEMAKQAKLEAAVYDFAEYNGQVGVITKDVCKEGEELLTLHELIGDVPSNPNHSVDTDMYTDIYYVFDKLEEKLRLNGYGEEMIDSCILQLRKQFLFDLYVLETDRHTENISFVIGKDLESGSPTIRLSPMYDTESALVLYEDEELMKKVSGSFLLTSNVTDMQEPKICVIPERKTEEVANQSMLEMLQSKVGRTYATESEEIWKTTLDFLVEDERAFDYLEQVLNNMDISKAIEQVEVSKDCEIPEVIKNMAIGVFEDRKQAIAYEMMLDIDIDGKMKEKGDIGLT